MTNEEQTLSEIKTFLTSMTEETQAKVMECGKRVTEVVNSYDVEIGALVIALMGAELAAS